MSCRRVSLNHDGTDGSGNQSSRLSRLRAMRRDGTTYQIWFRLPVPNPNHNPNPKTDPNPNPKKVTIMYAVQNDTEIKFNIVLYVKVIFIGQGWVYKRPIPQSTNHLRYDD